MSTQKSDNAPEKDKANWTETENPNTILVSVEAVGDTTVRPMRSAILRQIRPGHPPQTEASDKSPGE